MTMVTITTSATEDVDDEARRSIDQRTAGDQWMKFVEQLKHSTVMKLWYSMEVGNDDRFHVRESLAVAEFGESNRSTA